MDVTEQDLDQEQAYLQRQRQGQEYARKSRARANQKVRFDRETSDGENAVKLRRALIEQKNLNMEQVVSVEYEAWRLRTMGFKVYEIAAKLDASETQVNVWLQDAMVAIRGATKGLVDLDKELELSRTEELLKHYMPLAVMDHVMIERIRQGEAVPQEDFEIPQRNAWIVIELIKLRCKIKGLITTQTEINMMPAVDVFGWLRTQHEFIKDAAKNAPKDVLTLECDEPIDQPSTATNERGAEELPPAL